MRPYLMPVGLVITLACLGSACARECPRCAEPATPASLPATAAPATEEKVTMRAYFVAVLQRGSALERATPEEQRAAFLGHRDNIDALVQSGKMVVAGPFDAPEASPFANLAGLFI